MSRMFQSFARPQPAMPPQPPFATIPRVEDAGDDAGGPGWYESSRDLRRGLVVQELAEADEAGEMASLSC